MLSIALCDHYPRLGMTRSRAYDLAAPLPAVLDRLLDCTVTLILTHALPLPQAWAMKTSWSCTDWCAGSSLETGAERVSAQSSTVCCSSVLYYATVSAIPSQLRPLYEAFSMLQQCAACLC